MTKTRKQELSEKAHAERTRCRDWLIALMKDGRQKLATKDELRAVAMRELNVSKLSLDFGLDRGH